MAAPTAFIAWFVKNLDDYSGDARLYELDEPIHWQMWKDGEEVVRQALYVVVSATVVMFSGPETYIFPANKDGEVLNWIDLEGSFQGALDHAKALRRAGYKIATPTDG
jgi:hypothetical protein